MSVVPTGTKREPRNATEERIGAFESCGRRRVRDGEGEAELKKLRAIRKVLVGKHPCRLSTV